MSQPTQFPPSYDEDKVLDALLALAATSYGYRTWSRKVKTPTNVAPEERPAIFLFNDSDNQVWPAGEGGPALITLECRVLIYVWSIVQDIPPPSANLNMAVRAFRSALAPPPLIMRQSLGGVCQHCWIEGRTIKIPGDISGDGVAIVPVRILLPTY